MVPGNDSQNLQDNIRILMIDPFHLLPAAAAAAAATLHPFRTNTIILIMIRMVNIITMMTRKMEPNVSFETFATFTWAEGL